MTQHKIALVTGANRGLGFEIARQLADLGVIVYVCARTVKDAKTAADTIPNAIPIQLDVGNKEDIDNAVRSIDAQYGYLDILINNAGINPEEYKKTDAAVLREAFEINTIAPYVITSSFMPLLKKAPAARIVNQSSILGSMGDIAGSLDGGWVVPAYSASKAALNMLTVIQARELKGTAIKINAAHPGWVKTRMGGTDAHLPVHEGAKTAIRLALLPPDGPNGKFFHEEHELPW